MALARLIKMKNEKGFTLISKACNGFTLKSKACKGFALIRTLLRKNLDKVQPLRGFTLIELLVVVAIIGVLISLSFVGFLQARKSARDSKRRADLEQIRSALEIYRNDLKAYPPDLSTLLPDYISEPPKDPLSPTYDYGYSFEDSYPNRYYLCAFLEGGTTQETQCDDCGDEDCNYQTTSP
jgi:general secretion pathway protein G